MAQNLQMPMFGRAGAAQVSDNWTEVDHFDVDILAEYLLDDGLVTGAMNLDMSTAPGAVVSSVSPETSEDGHHPPVAETSLFTSAPTPTPLLPPRHLHPGAALSSSTTFPDLPASVPNIQGQSVVHHQHEDPTSKRRRVEGGTAVMVTATNTSAPVLSGEQLAAAAAQAMTQGRGRKKSQAQIDRRRERNRILARRTRLRKKFFFESLQKEVMDLQQENMMLKELVKENLAQDASKAILDECDAMEKLPPAVLEACGENGELDSQDFNLVKSIQGSQHSFVITDPSLNDNPIVFASDGFLKMTGYARDQVLGRNCRFLQGTDTHADKVKKIGGAISTGEDATVTMINYTADGTPFWNKLFVAALRDIDNNVVNYIGVTVKVAGPEPGDPEHGKALPEAVKPQGGNGEEAESAVEAIDDAVSAAVAAASGVN